MSDGTEQAVEVLDGFNVHREMVATCVNVVLEAGFGVFNHQVGIENGVGTERFSQASNHRRTEGEVGHEIAVHDVEMKPIKARINRFIAVGGQVGEVRGEDAGCNDHVIPQACPIVAI